VMVARVRARMMTRRCVKLVLLRCHSILLAGIPPSAIRGKGNSGNCRPVSALPPPRAAPPALQPYIILVYEGIFIGIRTSPEDVHYVIECLEKPKTEMKKKNRFMKVTSFAIGVQQYYFFLMYLDHVPPVKRLA
jgi:hypothetical protein